jgi:hypothetical protein
MFCFWQQSQDLKTLQIVWQPALDFLLIDFQALLLLRLQEITPLQN